MHNKNSASKMKRYFYLKPNALNLNFNSFYALGKQLF